MTQKRGNKGMAFEEELKTLIERTKKNGTDTSMFLKKLTWE